MAGVAGQRQLYEVLAGESAVPGLRGFIWVHCDADEVRAV